ncbi:hypothetical protein [Mycolicibacterium peregrinum]|uniref:hypothetical protein n=1 Tax=Mycolicibacterium peregrinum TaxID=43304 RepID=UPI000AE2C13D|nr:hypothetical protein [Mycolicibacterium peregrinum]
MFTEDRRSKAAVGLSDQRVTQRVADLMQLNPVWVTLMGLGAVAAAFSTDQTADGIHWRFAPGTVSIIALALVWLPSVLRFVMLEGVSIKAGGIEATASGLLSSPDQLVGDLAAIRTKTDAIGEGQPAAQSSVEGIDSVIDRMAVQYLPADDVLSGPLLNQKARKYEELRANMPPGDARTRAMTTVVNDVRIRAAASPASAKSLAAQFLTSAKPGDRIVGLALVQGAPSVDSFDDVLRIFTGSLSGFEQYHSLRALDLIAPTLDSAQRGQAIEALETERTDPRGVGVMQDASIPRLLAQTLETLTSPGASVSEPAI